MSNFMKGMTPEHKSITIHASKLDNMLGEDAAEIGFDIAKCAHEGASAVTVYIDNDQSNNFDSDHITEAMRDFRVPSDNIWSMHYDAESNEVHIPVESTYIMDDYNSASLAVGVLDCAIKNNGKTTVVLDGFNDRNTYIHEASEAVKKCNGATAEIFKSQKVAPYCGRDVVRF